MTDHASATQISRTSLPEIVGPVLVPGEDEYEHFRHVWSGAIDRHPAVIARCTSAADVTAAVRFAADHDLPIAVRGGGHSFAGFGTCNGGLVIDLGLMKQVSVDADACRATAQGGVTWGEFDHATAKFGLATTGGLVSSTGIGGLTLGGGIGWLARKHGLSCDNLLSAEVVTAAGEVVRASEDDNPELFWALRGGGGNFGVVTSFEFKLHPVTKVLAGAFYYSQESAHEVLAQYEAWAGDEPDDLFTLVEFATAPDAEFVEPAYRGARAISIWYCYNGPDAAGRANVAPWQDVAPVVGVFAETMAYKDLQALFDSAYPPGLWPYVTAHYLGELTSGAISELVEAGATRPTTRSIVDIYHLQGEISRRNANATAFDHRDARYAVMIGGVGESSTNLPDCRAWAHDSFTHLAPYATGHAYSNFLADADEVAVRAAWSPRKYAQLTEIKKRYDPANRFRFNHNIRPA